MSAVRKAVISEPGRTAVRSPDAESWSVIVAFGEASGGRDTVFRDVVGERVHGMKRVVVPLGAVVLMR